MTRHRQVGNEILFICTNVRMMIEYKNKGNAIKLYSSLDIKEKDGVQYVYTVRYQWRYVCKIERAKNVRFLICEKKKFFFSLEYTKKEEFWVCFIVCLILETHRRLQPHAMFCFLFPTKKSTKTKRRIVYGRSTHMWCVQICRLLCTVYADRYFTRRWA